MHCAPSRRRPIHHDFISLPEAVPITPHHAYIARLVEAYCQRIYHVTFSFSYIRKWRKQLRPFLDTNILIYCWLALGRQHTKTYHPCRSAHAETYKRKLYLFHFFLISFNRLFIQPSQFPIDNVGGLTVLQNCIKIKTICIFLLMWYSCVKAHL